MYSVRGFRHWNERARRKGAGFVRALCMKRQFFVHLKGREGGGARALWIYEHVLAIRGAVANAPFHVTLSRSHKEISPSAPPPPGSPFVLFQAVLGGFLQATVPHLMPLTEPLVAASVRIYERIASELLPTPAKSHYTFNLRDLSKV